MADLLIPLAQASTDLTPITDAGKAIALGVGAGLGSIGAGIDSGSFLVSPGLGLMIWTLVLFVFTMWVLSKLAFPRIQEALDRRANAIRESIEVADLTVLATEKVTRKTLDSEDHRRLVQEALDEADFSALAGTNGESR